MTSEFRPSLYVYSNTVKRDVVNFTMQDRGWENYTDKSLTVTLCRRRLQTGSTCALLWHAEEAQRFLFTLQATSRNFYQWHASVGHMSRPPPAAHLLRGGATWPTEWRSSRRRRRCCWSVWGGGWPQPGLDTGPTWRPARSASWQPMCGWCGTRQPPPS